uniref:pentatricopeptide repeat-containing protein At1g11290-like n=1 Tax=Fragaria vesca subsp. vesca TaxID=101020 RepID=UPI0005CB1F04|nr:PREDICTED: pentatricopeptide repeat-containing protein At1g11290-like [Fragaria vesca subsp. vesca]
MKRREGLVKLFEACNSREPLLQLHSQALKSGFSKDAFFATKLIALYSKHESVGYARKVFDETPERSVRMYNAALRSYCREKQWEETMFMFRKMLSERKPDNFTVSIALKACAGLRAIGDGRVVHGFVMRNEEIASDVFVGSALVEFYSKCGKMGEALKVFEGFSQPDVFMWTNMVTGYEQNGNAVEALEFLSRMVTFARVKPERVTLVSAVSACAQLSSFRLGSCVHGVAVRNGFDSDLCLLNSLINLYAKTGSIRTATRLFWKMPEKDVISWSSMIACYTHNGDVLEALNLFEEMIDRGVEPNSVTVTNSLQACAGACNLDNGKKIHKLATRKGFELEVAVATSLIDIHSGLVVEGLGIFSMMLHQYQLKPRPEHYGILVDLLGRTGELDKAMEIVERMPNPAEPHVWGALLGACRIHNNVKLGEVVAKRLLELEPDDAASHASQEVFLAWGAQLELTKLKKTLSTINLVLQDAEKKQVKNLLITHWLGKLKDVCYDVDDVLDELEFRKLRKKVLTNNHGRVKGQVRHFFSRWSPTVFNFNIGHKVKEIRERLVEIDNEKRQFALVEVPKIAEDHSVPQGMQYNQRETDSLVEASEVIGRDDDKELIFSHLLHNTDISNEENVSVISILGLGGLGKTTLAKLVYNDSVVEENFEVKMWYEKKVARYFER